MFRSIKKRYQQSQLAKRFANGTFWSLLAGITYNGTMLIVGIILSHILGKYYYGQYGIVRSTINMFIVFSSFALGTTATKYVAEYRLKNKLKTERIINLSVIVAIILAIIVFVVCICSAKYIALNTLNTKELTSSLYISSFMILFLTLSGVINGILIGFEKFFLIFKQNCIAAIFLLAFSALLGYFFRVNGALIGLLIYLLVSFLIGLFYLRKIFKEQSFHFYLTGLISEINILWKFSLPSSLGGIVVTPIIWIANTILVNSQAGYSAMAGLDVIKQWYSAALFIPAVTSRVILPMLSNLNNEDNRKYNKVLTYSFFVNVGTATLVAIFLYFLSNIILSFYGNAFLEFRTPFCLMMIVAVVFVANSIVGQIILSKSYAWWGFAFNLIWGIIFIVCNIIFVQKYNMGVIGVVYSYLISYIVHTIIQSIFSWIILKK